MTSSNEYPLCEVSDNTTMYDDDIMTSYLGRDDPVDHGSGHHSSPHEAEVEALGLLRLTCSFHSNTAVAHSSTSPLTVPAVGSETQIHRYKGHIMKIRLFDNSTHVIGTNQLQSRFIQ